MKNDEFKKFVEETLKKTDYSFDEEQICETAKNLEELASLIVIFEKRKKQKHGNTESK